MSDLAPEYIAAREVLLDALDALSAHRENLVLVGAQAIYHHTGETDLAVPIMTTDADLALNVDRLENDPEIAAALRSAGFANGDQPGCWIGDGDVAVDLMVVPAQAGGTKPGARAARVPPHDKRTARITRGLEPALVDNAVATLGSFGPSDRSREMNLAGPSALIVAKLVKLDERLAEGRDRRIKSKDALDVFRLLQAIETEVLVAGFRRHQGDALSRDISSHSIRVLRDLGATPDSVLPRLAQTAALDDATIPVAWTALAHDLLDGIADL